MQGGGGSSAAERSWLYQHEHGNELDTKVNVNLSQVVIYALKVELCSQSLSQPIGLGYTLPRSPVVSSLTLISSKSKCDSVMAAVPFHSRL